MRKGGLYGACQVVRLETRIAVKRDLPIDRGNDIENQRRESPCAGTRPPKTETQRFLTASIPKMFQQPVTYQLIHRFREDCFVPHTWSQKRCKCLLT